MDSRTFSYTSPRLIPPHILSALFSFPSFPCLSSSSQIFLSEFSYTFILCSNTALEGRFSTDTLLSEGEIESYPMPLTASSLPFRK